VVVDVDEDDKKTADKKNKVPKANAEETEEVEEEEIEEEEIEEEEVEEKQAEEDEAEDEKTKLETGADAALGTVDPLSVVGVLRPVLFVPGSKHLWQDPSDREQQAQHNGVCASIPSVPTLITEKKFNKLVLSETITCTFTEFNAIEAAITRKDFQITDLNEMDLNNLEFVMLYGSHGTRHLHPILSFILLKAATKFKLDLVESANYARRAVFSLFLPKMSSRDEYAVGLNVDTWNVMYKFIAQIVYIDKSTDTQKWVISNVVHLLNLLYNIQRTIAEESDVDVPEMLQNLVTYLEIESEWNATIRESTSNALREEEDDEDAESVIDKLVHRARKLCADDGNGRRLFFRNAHRTTHVQLEVLFAALLNEQNYRLRSTQTQSRARCDVRDRLKVENFVNQFNHIPIREEIQQGNYLAEAGKLSSNAYLTWCSRVQHMLLLQDTNIKMFRLWCRYWYLLLFVVCVPRCEPEPPKLHDPTAVGSTPVMEVYFDFLTRAPSNTQFERLLQDSKLGCGAFLINLDPEPKTASLNKLFVLWPFVNFDSIKKKTGTVAKIMQNYRRAISWCNNYQLSLCYPACSAGNQRNTIRTMRKLQISQHMGWVTFHEYYPDGIHISRISMDKRQYSTDKLLFADIFENDVNPDSTGYRRAKYNILDKMQPSVASCTMFIDWQTRAASASSPLCIIYNRQRLAYEASPTNKVKRGFQTEPKKNLSIRKGGWTVAVERARQHRRARIVSEKYNVFRAHLLRVVGSATLTDEANYAIIADAESVDRNTYFFNVPPQFQMSFNNSAYNATLFWERQLILFLEVAVTELRQDPFEHMLLPIYKNVITQEGDNFRVADFVHFAVSGTTEWGAPISIGDESSDDTPLTAATLLRAAFEKCNNIETYERVEDAQAHMHTMMLRLFVAVALCEFRMAQLVKPWSYASEIGMAWRIVVSMFLQMPTRISPPTATEPIGVWWAGGETIFTRDRLLSAMQSFLLAFVFEIARHCAGTSCNWRFDVTRSPESLIRMPYTFTTGMKLIVVHALCKHCIVPMNGVPLGSNVSEEERGRLDTIRGCVNVINDIHALEYMLTRSLLISLTREPRNKTEMLAAEKIDERDVKLYRKLFKRPLEKIKKLRSDGSELTAVYSAWNTLFFYMPAPMQPFVAFVKALEPSQVTSATFPETTTRTAAETLANLNLSKQDRFEKFTPTLLMCASASGPVVDKDDVYRRTAHVLEAAVASIPKDEINRLARLVDTTMARMEAHIAQSTVPKLGNTDVMLAAATAAYVEHTVCADGHRLLAVAQDRNGAAAFLNTLDTVLRNVALQFAVRTLTAQKLEMCVSLDVLFIMVGGIALCLAEFFNAIKDCEFNAAKKLEILLQSVGVDKTPSFNLNQPITFDVARGGLKVTADTDTAIAKIVYQPVRIIASTVQIYYDGQNRFLKEVYPAVLKSLVGSALPVKAKGLFDSKNSPAEVWKVLLGKLLPPTSSSYTEIAHFDVLYGSLQYTLFDNRLAIDAVEKLRVAFDKKMYASVPRGWSDDLKGEIAHAEHTKLTVIISMFAKYMIIRIGEISILDNDVSNAAWLDELGKMLTILSEIKDAEAHEHGPEQNRYGIRLQRQLDAIMSVERGTSATFPSAWCAYWKNPTHVLDFVRAYHKSPLAGGTAPEEKESAPGVNYRNLESGSSVWESVVALFTPAPVHRRHARLLSPQIETVEDYRPDRIESQNGPVIDLINEANLIHKFRVWFLGMDPVRWTKSWEEGKWGGGSRFQFYKHGIPLKKMFVGRNADTLVGLLETLSTWDGKSEDYKEDYMYLNLAPDSKTLVEDLKYKVENFKKYFNRHGGHQKYAFLVPYRLGSKRYWTYIRVKIPTTVLRRAPLLFNEDDRTVGVVIEMANKTGDDGTGGDVSSFNLAMKTAYNSAKDTIEEMVKKMAPRNSLGADWAMPTEPQPISFRGPEREFARDAYVHFVGASAGVFRKGVKANGVQMEYKVKIDTSERRVDTVARPNSKHLVETQRALLQQQQGSASESPMRSFEALEAYQITQGNPGAALSAVHVLALQTALATESALGKKEQTATKPAAQTVRQPPASTSKVQQPPASTPKEQQQQSTVARSAILHVQQPPAPIPNVQQPPAPIPNVQQPPVVKPTTQRHDFLAQLSMKTGANVFVIDDS